MSGAHTGPAEAAPKAFLSKAWSGSSWREGVQSMFSAVVKREIPDDLDDLEKHVQDA